MRFHRTLIRAAMLGALALPATVLAAGEDDPALLASETMPKAAKSLLLDVTATTAGVFATGERGTVLRQGADGQWQQLTVPTRTTLTGIASVEGEVWVAGHAGVILRSSDNGDTWTRQRVDLWTPDSTDITQGAPILDLLFTDASTGWAVGAFSLLLKTTDGGQTWNAVAIGGTAAADAAQDQPDDSGILESGAFSADELILEEESDPHLNAITRDAAGTLYIAGERGALFRSRDGGMQWERLSFPYDGSLFGILTFAADHVLVFGLRGSVYESTDGGERWSKLETGVRAALMGGAALPGGGAVIVGSEGVVLRRDDAASPFVATTFTTAEGETPVLSGVLPQADGGLLLIGEKGVDTYGSR